jgi:hypothetical protein
MLAAIGAFQRQCVGGGGQDRTEAPQARCSCAVRYTTERTGKERPHINQRLHSTVAPIQWRCAPGDRSFAIELLIPAAAAAAAAAAALTNNNSIKSFVRMYKSN